MSKQENKGRYTQKKRSNKALIMGLMILVILLAAAAVLFLFSGEEEPALDNTIPQATAGEEKTPVQPEATEDPSAINLGYGIYVTDIGGYTGMYMEDGSDEILSNILMLVVKNNGAEDIQYAEITMDLGEQTALFAITTLPVGESMVLLEKNRMAWDRTVDYDAILPSVDNLAYFQEPISTQEDKLKIQIADGAINITNISGEDISGNITIYYKNAAADLLYGGITYRITVEGGLKAEEIRQVMTNHASDTGSRIMFTTISQ